MRNGHADEIANLVEPGRVHRRVYTDPDLFELEMERIFGRAWLFVGHTSQVPNPGDFITTDLGRQPVIMVRHRDGRVHVLLNRCTHRGAKVVNERCGHAQRLTCCYHGWSFDTDAGKQEILMRRIGKNELSAIELCHELVSAEKEHYAGAHPGEAPARGTGVVDHRDPRAVELDFERLR